MRESQLQADILRALAGQSRIRVWRNNTGSAQVAGGRWIQFGLVGSADLLGILAPSGQLLAIECKTSSGRVTDNQRAFGAMVTKFGGVYVLARSLADVLEGLKSWIDTPQQNSPMP